jgi:hypothetical protein
MEEKESRKKGFFARLLSAALNPFRDIAEELESLPDGAKVKPWTEILISFISTPLAIIGASVTVATASFAAIDIYIKYSTKQAEEQRIRNSPVHVSLEIKATRLPASDAILNNIDYVATSVDIIAKNPSPRDFVLLNNKWTAFGIKVHPHPEVDPSDKNSPSGDFNPTDAKRFDALSETSDPLAYGSVFTDNILRPSETLTRRIIVYAPKSQYNYLRLSFSLPIISRSAQETLAKNKSQILLLRYLDKDVTSWIVYQCPEGTIWQEIEGAIAAKEKPLCVNLAESDNEVMSRKFIEEYEFLQKTAMTEIPLQGN